MSPVVSDGLDDVRLRFRRQFLLTRTPVHTLAEWGWVCHRLGDRYVYAHPDLPTAVASNATTTLVLLGSLFDPFAEQRSSADILQEVLERAVTVEALVVALKRFVGSYVVLSESATSTVAIHDALGLREIYYCTTGNDVICGSQPTLITTFANPPLQRRTDPAFVEFVETQFSNPWDAKWVGDETHFAELKHLLPNHLLNLVSLQASRYWPHARVARIGLDEAVSKSCAFLEGALRAMANRHSLMMAITAGTDSRTLLAASRGLRDKIYYFINDESLGDHHPDIAVPTAICDGLSIPFHVHEVRRDVDENFGKTFLANTAFATARSLPTVYNVYFRQHADKVNILGIGEIGRTRFGKASGPIPPYQVAYKLGYTSGRYVMDQCARSLADIEPASREHGVNPLTVFYWEQMLGNWGTVGNSESDIAIEELNPYDSHYLYELFLGVDDRYTTYKNNQLFREMIRRMWPELLAWPINPPHTRRDQVLAVLAKLNVYSALRSAKYHFSYARFLCESWRADATE